MKYAILKQLPLNHNNVFRGYTEKIAVDLHDYVNTWVSEFNSSFDDLYICERMYEILNTTRPDHFAGRSLSVSDVIQIIDEEKPTSAKANNYYCDSFGWKKLEEC